MARQSKTPTNHSNQFNNLSNQNPATSQDHSSPTPSSSPDPYDSDTPLPFPAPLNRTAFLDPAFNAASYLSTATNFRFQSLEDLQSELRELLQNLHRDLLDLVNDNYTDFLSLGERLKGGEEQIEEIRVGLLGFRGDVSGVRSAVAGRAEGVRELLQEKRTLREELVVGRRLLEVEERLGGLESRLGMATGATGGPDARYSQADEEDEQIGDFRDWDESWLRDDTFDDLDSMPSGDEDGDGDADDGAKQGDVKTQRDIPRRLARNLENLKIIQLLSGRCAGDDGKAHPFILAQRDRISQTKDVLRRDLEAAIRSQGDVKAKQRVIRLRGELDEE